MFDKVLVANRGDVAIRVMRACRELGVTTVGVYSEADRNALHVRYADEAYPIDGESLRSSYLQIGRIVNVAIRSGADAVHPGYGFLAESPQFAQACAEAGLVFIGPNVDTLHLLNDRLRLNRKLREAKVPVLPVTREGLDAEACLRAAEGIGFPLLVRPVGVSSGPGERAALSPDELTALLNTYRRETEEPRSGVYLEPWLAGARRIEIHVFADRDGRVIYLGDSEGTIRRRHQKLIEEAPSPAMTPELRQEMGRVACDVARIVGFAGIGTVEFWLDGQGRFHFLNMNPRLWVGHPVIEMVTGIDLVKEQIRIASGRRLRYGQEDVTMRGHAIECRVHAEDPYDGFKPSVGQINRLIEPGGPFIRVETGVYEGFQVSYYYDPLLAKLVVWGESRGEAILRMRRALAEYRVVGVKTNLPFLQQIMNRTSFIGGQFDLSQEDEYFAVSRGVRDELLKASAIAAAILAYRQRAESLAAFRVTQRPSPWKVAGRWEVMGE